MGKTTVWEYILLILNMMLTGIGIAMTAIFLTISIQQGWDAALLFLAGIGLLLTASSIPSLIYFIKNWQCNKTDGYMEGFKCMNLPQLENMPK